MIERRTLAGGMNMDDVIDFIPKNDYLVAHNCRVTRDKNGGGGSLKPFPSTQALASDVTAGTKTVIGSYTDEVNQRVFFFRHNDSGVNRIWCFFRRSTTALIVLQESNVTGGLGFETARSIHSIGMIGNYLYWTDGNNEPRRIDVERGLRANNPTYTSPDGSTPVAYNLPLAQWDISVARRVPRHPLKWEKLISSEESDIEDQTVNYLDKNAVQFAARYIYSSGELSTLGSYSKIAPHNADSKFNRYVYKYDTIRVYLDKDESIDEEVDKIEILVRRDNIGSWYVVKTFDREKEPALFEDHNTIGDPELSFLFFNNEQGIAISDSETNVPFFDVPIKSNTLEIADNRLFLGNNLKGYPHELGEALTLTRRDYTWSLSSVWRMWGEYFLIEWHCGTGIAEKVVLRMGDWFGPAAGWYDTPFTSAQFNSNSLPLTTTLDTNDKYPIVDQNIPPEDLIQYLNPTCDDWTVTEYPDNPTIVSDFSAGPMAENARAFRKGKKYKAALVFYDYAGRNAGITHQVAEINIPNPVDFEDTYTVGIDWEIDPTTNIPDWAHSYAVVRTRITEPFIATIPSSLRYANKEDDGTYTFDDGGTPAIPNLDYSLAYEAIAININRLLQVRGIGYTYSEGDIIKLVTPADEIFYLKILGTYLEYIITENYDIGTISVTSEYYIEIITPQVEEDEFWEVGHNYDIIDPGTVDKAFEVTSGTMTGDTFFISQDSRPEARPLPAMNPNNKYWQFWPQDYGRSSIELFSTQRRYETEVAWSSTYFPGTEINQLNQFLSGDIRQLDSAVGALQRLVFTSRTQEYGTVMLALGQNEVSSIYLGRTEFYNTNESPSLITTVNVVGNINVLKGGFGTINPESVFENDGDVYWFSAIKGAFVRYARDGVNPISDLKISTFAAWLGNQVVTRAFDIPGQSSLKIIGGFDEFNREALWTIPVIGTFPVSYVTLDAVAEDITLTEISPGVFSGTIVAGEVYRFSMRFNGVVSTSTTVWDMFHGQETVITNSSGPSVLFVGAPGAPQTITVVTSPPLDTTIHTQTLEKLRINPYTLINLMPKTIAFSEESKRWAWTGSMVPDWWGRVGDQLVSFKANALYMHNSLASIGTFYSVAYPAWVSLPFNERPNEVKRLQGVSLEASAKPSYIHIRTEEPNVQSSDLVASEIKTEEGIFSSSILRDRLSPNTSGTIYDKLRRGDEMRGRYSKVLIEWSKLSNFAARIFNLISRPSGGNKT